MEVFLIENNTFAINLTNITHRSNDGNGHFVFKSSDNSFSITLSEEVMQVILFVAVKIGFICCICYCLSKNRRFTRCRRRLVTTLCGEETPAPSGDLNSGRHAQRTPLHCCFDVGLCRRQRASINPLLDHCLHETLDFELMLV